jgi:hypothetical protein
MGDRNIEFEKEVIALLSKINPDTGKNYTWSETAAHFKISEMTISRYIKRNKRSDVENNSEFKKESNKKRIEKNVLDLDKDFHNLSVVSGLSLALRELKRVAEKNTKECHFRITEKSIIEIQKQLHEIDKKELNKDLLIDYNDLDNALSEFYRENQKLIFQAMGIDFKLTDVPPKAVNTVIENQDLSKVGLSSVLNEIKFLKKTVETQYSKSKMTNSIQLHLDQTNVIIDYLEGLSK